MASNNGFHIIGTALTDFVAIPSSTKLSLLVEVEMQNGITKDIYVVIPRALASLYRNYRIKGMLVGITGRCFSTANKGVYYTSLVVDKIVILDEDADISISADLSGFGDE